MAIQVKRKLGQPTAQDLAGLLEGQPLVNLSSGDLYIGGSEKRVGESLVEEERSARDNADNNLRNMIQAETTRATGRENALDAKIDAETQARQAFDNAHNNIKNGSTQTTTSEPYKGGSIISAWEYDDDAAYTTAQLPVASGHESIAWGKACKATGKRAIAFGNGAESHGNTSVVFAQKSIAYGPGVSYSLKRTGNNQPTYSGTTVDGANASFITGNGNHVTEPYNAVFGLSNYCFGRNNAMFGEANTLSTSTIRSLIGGSSSITSSSHSITWGKSLSTVSTGSIAKATFGQFNQQYHPEYVTIMEIGNGTDDNNKSNAFEVLQDGRAKVFGTPQTNEDVVRLEDLTSKIQSLDVSATTLNNLETINSISEVDGKISVTKQSIDTYSKSDIDDKDDETLESAKSYTDDEIAKLDVSATTLTSLETIKSISETDGKIAVTKQSIDTYSKSNIDSKVAAKTLYLIKFYLYTGSDPYSNGSTLCIITSDDYAKSSDGEVELKSPIISAYIYTDANKMECKSIISFKTDVNGVYASQTYRIKGIQIAGKSSIETVGYNNTYKVQSSTDGYAAPGIIPLN